MREQNEKSRFNFAGFDAILCDLDGVITKTSMVHATAWKRLFDDYLKTVATHTGSTFKPFELEEDYRQYVDGKARYDGVRDFLRSRALSLPSGSPHDMPEQ